MNLNHDIEDEVDDIFEESVTSHLKVEESVADCIRKNVKYEEDDIFDEELERSSLCRKKIKFESAAPVPYETNTSSCIKNEIRLSLDSGIKEEPDLEDEESRIRQSSNIGDFSCTKCPFQIREKSVFRAHVLCHEKNNVDEIIRLLRSNSNEGNGKEIDITASLEKQVEFENRLLETVSSPGEQRDPDNSNDKEEGACIGHCNTKEIDVVDLENNILANNMSPKRNGHFAENTASPKQSRTKQAGKIVKKTRPNSPVYGKNVRLKDRNTLKKQRSCFCCTNFPVKIKQPASKEANEDNTKEKGPDCNKFCPNKSRKLEEKIMELQGACQPHTGRATVVASETIKKVSKKRQHEKKRNREKNRTESCTEEAVNGAPKSKKIAREACMNKENAKHDQSELFLYCSIEEYSCMKCCFQIRDKFVFLRHLISHEEESLSRLSDSLIDYIHSKHMRRNLLASKKNKVSTATTASKNKRTEKRDIENSQTVLEQTPKTKKSPVVDVTRKRNTASKETNPDSSLFSVNRRANKKCENYVAKYNLEGEMGLNCTEQGFTRDDALTTNGQASCFDRNKREQVQSLSFSIRTGLSKVQHRYSNDNKFVLKVEGTSNNNYIRNYLNSTSDSEEKENPVNVVVSKHDGNGKKIAIDSHLPFGEYGQNECVTLLERCTYAARKAANKKKLTREGGSSKLHKSIKTEIGQGKYILSCNLCSYKSYKKKYLNAHSLIHRDTIVKCSMCAFVTNLERNLASHMIIHADPEKVKKYKCPSCPYETIRLSTLAKHKVLHTSPDQLRMFYCDRCPYKSKRNGNLTKHLFTHQSPDQIPLLYCAKCPFKAKQKDNLRVHMTRVHGPVVRTYSCTKCLYATNSKGALTAHQLTHKGLGEVRTYDCSFCPYRSKYNSHLKAHVMVKHTSADEAITHKCGKCGYETRKKSNLNAHMVVHMRRDEIVMFNCAHCSYGSRYKSSLIVHFSRHHSERPQLLKSVRRTKVENC